MDATTVDIRLLKLDDSSSLVKTVIHVDFFDRLVYLVVIDNRAEESVNHAPQHFVRWIGA